MIRSGLTNVQKAGYAGYPHERDQTPRNDIERPFVSVGDETVLRKSDYSDPLANPITVPAPIMYNDIFAKKTTPDERIYVLKQIQQGLEKIQKGILGRDSQQVPQIPLPQYPITPTQPILLPTPNADGTPGVPTQFPALIGESPITPDGVDLELEEEAQDVVANPPTAPTETEYDRAMDEWLHMQHSPQWRQIEGRPFNVSPASSYHTASPGSASTSFRSAASHRGPFSDGSYPSASPHYPTLPPLYPDLAMTPASGGRTPTQRLSPAASEEVHRIVSAASEQIPPYSSPSSDFAVNQALDVIHRELQGVPLDQQREALLRLSLEQRQNIAQAIIDNPNHPITSERIIQMEIPLFAPPPSYLSAGTTRSYSPITPSPTSLATTISSNGVGPRMRSSPRSADSRMSVPMSVYTPSPTGTASPSAPFTVLPPRMQLPPPRQFRRANAPPQINTNNVQRPQDIQQRRRNVNRRTDTFIPDQSRMSTRRNN